MWPGTTHRGHVRRWTCPQCGDEMCEHFRSSHERICTALAAVEQIQVNALLQILQQ